MPQFSRISRERLLSCDSRLIAVCSDAIAFFDFSVVCGHRTNEEQDLLFAQGRITRGPIVTYKRGGESIHNTMPSRAIDLAPWVSGRGIVWDEPVLFGELAGVIMYCAWKRRIDITWGGHWMSFKDYPHFQTNEQTYPVTT
jgi:peptidoglycan L-alanyl-D-glutamate endopeptidase CwlK